MPGNECPDKEAKNNHEEYLDTSSADPEVPDIRRFLRGFFRCLFV